MNRAQTLTSFLALTTAALAQHDNLVRNGSFESGATVRGTQWVVVRGDEVRGWRVTGGQIDHVEKHFKGSHGKRCIDLAGGSAGSLAQQIATIPGRSYTVLFDVAAHHLATVVQLQVAAGSQTQNYFVTSTRNQANLGWTTREFRFVAKGDNTPLFFRSLVGGNFGPTIDNVRCFETANEDLVRNGSFEQTVRNQNSLYVQRGDRSITNWEITNGSVNHHGRDYHKTLWGAQCVQLYGSSKGIIRQTIRTVPGQRYVVLFRLSGDTSPSGRQIPIKRARLITGNVSRVYQFNTTGMTRSNLAWVAKSQSFVATSPTTFITFQNAETHTGAYTALIDNVRVYRDREDNLIANGGFESVRRIATLPGRSTDLRAWQVDRPIDVTPNSYWRSASGNISIDLDGLRARGSMRCYFAAVPNRQYVLRFQMSANPDGPARLAQARIYTPDGRWTPVSYDSRGATRANMNYVEKVITFRAKQKNETIVFDSLSTPNSSYGIVIDNVHVEELETGVFLPFGHSCSGNGSQPQLVARSTPRIGQPLQLRSQGMKAGLHTGLLLLGFSRDTWAGVLPLPFDSRPIGARGCAIYVSGDILLPFFASPTADLSLPIPNDSRLVGLQLNTQSLVFDRAANAAGLLASNAGIAVLGS